MMGRQTGDQSQLFYLFNLERRIPEGLSLTVSHSEFDPRFVEVDAWRWSYSGFDFST